ncbi:FtsW/RodA/SpoVE family cell cycle protein, partial [Candidatus Dojkabacteria bacterium]|nr:FtsW/RodA/SpoVE family cell cycle protein [Candidatus Dojkabacteria bacterium]
MLKRRSSRKYTTSLGSPDATIIFIVGGLTLFGLIMVYSASFLAHSNTFHFFIRQILFTILGVGVGVAAYLIDYRILTKLILPGLILSILLLIAVLIPGIGKEIQG